MKEISRFCYSKEYLTAGSEDSEGEKRKSRGEGWYGHRRASAEAVSSQSPVAGERLQYRALSERAINGQGKSSPAAAPHLAAVPRTAEVKEVKPISALSDQQSAGMSTGARPKQRPQSATRETVLQAVPVPAPSDPGEADDIEGGVVMPALPQQLSEKGYRLIDTKPLGKGTTQLVYCLARKAEDGSERPGFVVKFPCEAGRARALQGLEIREKLARLKGGDKYFVPVVEKVMENGQLICHVEPGGVPVMEYLDKEGLDLTQVFSLINHMLVAVGVMHAQGIAHSGIKPDHLIIEDPVIGMTARFCDFVRAVESDEIYTPVIIPVDTCANMCASVSRQMPCSPVMADLWAFTFTAWTLMAADIPSLHWLEGVRACTQRRNKVFPELAACFSLNGWNCISGSEFFPDDRCVMYDEALLDRLRRHSDDEKILGQLQCFFWDNLEFPADIENLCLSPAEKHILKEMLSIMFLSSDYGDKFERMMTLVPAALSCVDSFLSHSDLDEETAMALMGRAADYRQCGRTQGLTGIMQLCERDHSPGEFFCGDMLAESAPIDGEQYQKLGDFMMRRQCTLTRFAKQEAVDWTDVEDMLIDHLVEEETLEFLEEKNDSQLFGWLVKEWETRCQLQIFSHRLGQVC